MKFLLSLFLLSCFTAQAAVVTVTLHFTNRTQIGNTFTNGSRVVTYTNAPLSPQTWLFTNSPTLAATQMARYFGAQYPGYYTRMTNATNVTITGLDLQLSFMTNYAAWSTNSSTATNGWLVTLPFLNQVETNRTNTASELVSGISLYSTQAIATNATALSNYLSLGPQTQTFSNKISLNNTNVNGITTNGVYTNGVIGGGTLAGTITSVANITGGTQTAPFVTNAHSIHSTNVTADFATITDAIISNGLEVDGEASLLGAVSITGALVVDNTAQFVESMMITDTDGLNHFLASVTETNEFTLSSENHGVVFYVSNNIFGLRPVAYLTNGFVSSGTERLSSIVRSRFSGTIRTDEGAYSSLTGFSNNVVQLSTNAVTRLSGATGNYNINSLRFADGIEAENRWAEIINDTAYTATIIDSALDGFETQATNRIRSGVNITIAAGAGAKLKYSTSYSRWELMYPSPLAQFTISGTTNQVYFGSTNSVPANTATVRKWISVQVTGESNAYRLPLYE